MWPGVLQGLKYVELELKMMIMRKVSAYAIGQWKQDSKLRWRIIWLFIHLLEPANHSWEIIGSDFLIVEL